MAIEKINIGNVVNDGLGDDLRTAFRKVNDNFVELTDQLSVNIETSGSGSSVIKEKIGNNIVFKSLVSGRFIQITDLDTSLEIRNTAPDGFTKITTNSGSVEAKNIIDIVGDVPVAAITIQGGIDIETNVQTGSSVITIDNRRINNKTFTSILSNYDFGPILGNFENAVQLAISNSNLDFGTIELPGRLDLDLGSIVNPD